MRAEAWEGFDFMTIDSGINRLAASYAGVPFQARGVDPNTSAKAALSFWQGATYAPPVGDDPNPMDALPGVGALTNPGTLKKIGFGALGGLLAIVLIALGIIIVIKG
jgi:hypothetical protein